MAKLFPISLIVAALVVSGLAAQARPQDIDLQAAIKVETVTGDLDAAIKQYRAIVDKYAASDHATAARALLRMAECYRKMGAAEADRIYAQIVKDYADQTGPAERARAALAESRAGDSIRARSINAMIKVPNWNQISDYSPDGRSAVIGLQAGSPGRVELSVGLVDLETGAMRVLAPRLTGSEIESLLFSPDGKHVVTKTLTGPRSAPHDENLVVLSVDTSAAPITVPSVGGSADDWGHVFVAQQWSRPSWSPNGVLLAHLSRTSTPRACEIRILNTATSEDRPLGITVTGPPDLRWSPSGAELAFRSVDAEGTEAIHVVTVATGAARSIRLPASPNLLTRLQQWTTSGRIVTRRKSATRVAPGYGPSEIDDTILIDAQTGEARTTCTGRPSPGGAGGQKNNGTFGYGISEVPDDLLKDVCLDVTPDGAAQIVWRHASRHLWVIDTATLAERPLTLAAGEEQFGFMSPDGKLEAFISNRDARWAIYVAPIASAPIAQPVLLESIYSLPHIAGLQWTRTGVVAIYDLWDSDVYRVRMDPGTGHSTGAVERLTQDTTANAYPAVSPDSAAIAYVTWIGSRIGLSVMTGDGNDEHRVLDDLVPALTAPFWRDQDDLIFAAQTQGVGINAEHRLVSLNLKTHQTSDIGVIPALEGSRGAWHWDYLRATNEIVYYPDPIAHGSVSIHARSLSTGVDRTFATIDAAAGFLSAILLSPDGRRLAFLLDPTAPGGSTQPYQVGVLNLDTHEQKIVPQARPITESQALVAWSPDGRYLLYGATRPRVLDLATGDSWLLIDQTTQSVPEEVDLTSFGDDQGGSWAPDGSYVALHLYWGRTERQLVSGVTSDSVMKALGRIH